MQHVSASDYMTGSAKAAVGTALRGGKAQVVHAEEVDAYPTAARSAPGASPAPRRVAF